MSFQPLLTREERAALDADFGLPVDAELEPAPASASLFLCFLAAAGITWFGLSILFVIYALGQALF